MIAPIKNAPVRFLESGETPFNDLSRDCNCITKPFFQLSKCSDTVEFQVNTLPITGDLINKGDFDLGLPDLVTNGDFATDTDWVKGTGWTISGGTANHASGVAGDLEQTGILTNGRRYQIRFTIKNYVAGGLTPKAGTAAGTAVSADGIYYQAITANGVDLVFTANAAFDGSIDDIEVVDLTDYTTGISGNWAFDANARWVWDRTNQKALKHTGSPADLKQLGILTANKYYGLTFTISGYGGSGSVTPKLGSTALTPVSANGTFTLFGFANSADLEFETDGFFTGSIDDVSMMEFTQIGWAIKNANTGVFDFADIDQLFVTYSPDDSKVLVKFTWAEVLPDGYSCVDGCYKICLFDLDFETTTFDGEEGVLGSELILNGGFDNADNWTIEVGNIVLGGGVADFNVGLLGALSQILSNNVNIGERYRIGFDMLNWVAGEIASFSFTNTSLPGADDIFTNINANGTHTVDHTVAGGESFYDKIIFVSNISPDFEITNVVMKRFYTIAEGLTAGIISTSFCSEPYKVAQSFLCTKLLSWTNDEDAFGFNYSTLPITHFLRVESKLWKQTWEKVKTTNTDSAGKIRILHSLTTEATTFTVYEMPKYLHAALAIGVEHDTFEVDSEQYINEETEYSPNWRDSSLLASVTIELIKDNQLLENSNC